MTLPTRLLTSAIASVVLAGTARAVTTYGLGADNHLYRFDSAGGVSVDVGLISAAGIVDLDFHAANGVLYGMTSTGLAYGIDTATGNASLRVTSGASLTGTVQDFDFNPVADRLRVSTSGGGNFRVIPDFTTSPSPGGMAGGVTVDGTYSGAPGGVIIVGTAYTNAFDTPALNTIPAHSTTLYSIGSDGRLYVHSNGAGAAGSFGVMMAVGTDTIGALGMNVGFDITADNLAFVSNGNSIYTVNLTTGDFSDLPSLVIGPAITSIAVVPEPSTMVLGALAGLAMLRRRR